MTIFKRGNVYWYHFLFGGDHIQRSTKQGNQRIARQMEAVHRATLAKGEVGIVERKIRPSFTDLSRRFVDHVESRHENKPQTVTFYKAKLSRLESFAGIANARIDRIDESVIEEYVVMRRTYVGITTINRELATLRRMLRLAREWNELDRVPVVRLLKGERERDFVLTRTQEQVYLAACPPLLHDIALLLLETGLRIGEVLDLQWTDVILEPLPGSRFGYLRVRSGKSKNAARNVPLTDRAVTMLRNRPGEQAGTLFANRAGTRYLVTSINHLHRKTCTLKVDGKKREIFSKDFVLHSLRHTMLTRLGESGVDAFTIMRIAGHSSVLVSQKYVHPSPEAVERAFERLQDTGRPVETVPAKFKPATVSATSKRKVSVSH